MGPLSWESHRMTVRPRVRKAPKGGLALSEEQIGGGEDTGGEGGMGREKGGGTVIGM